MNSMTFCSNLAAIRLTMGLVSRGRIKVGAKTMERFSADIMFLLFCSITLQSGQT